MKLILLYGPMAVGKLTISKELKRLCDANNFPIKIFHNHDTVDLITKFLPMFTDEWFYLSGLFRLKIYEACAKTGQNLISTLVYAKNFDDDFIHDIIDVIQKHDDQSYLYI